MVKRTFAFLLLILVVTTQGVYGGVVVESLIPGDENAGGIPLVGQSLHTPTGGVPWDHLTFNFYRSFLHSDGAPHAVGGLYLLDQAYFGTPGGLSPSTPGYIAHTFTTQAEDAGDEWVFATDVEVQPDQDYFFFTDSAPGTLISFHPNNYPDGSFFEAWPETDTFTDYGGTAADMAFQLEGTVVPEPGTLALLSLGLGLQHVLRRRENGSR